MESSLSAMLAAALLAQIMSACADSRYALPQWKTQLMHFPKWEGHYVYLNRTHLCQMVVHSVQQDAAGGATVSFSADDATLDMNAHSEDDIRIYFRTETIYRPGVHFYDGFAFVVEMMQYGSLFVMVGNITHPVTSASTIELYPQGSVVINHMTSSGLSIGLAVGISVFLFIVCTVIGIAILRWAIRKGYLRHVARSYKIFRNHEPAAEPPVSFSDDQQQDRAAQQVNLHI